jgi:hypothetical protein
MLGTYGESFKGRFSLFAHRHRWHGLWQAAIALVALGIAVMAGFEYVVARHELAAYKKWPVCTGDQQSKCLMVGTATVESMTPSARGRPHATVDLKLQDGTDDEVDFGSTSETRIFRVLHVGAQIIIRFPPHDEIDSITYQNVKADTTAAPGSQAGLAQLILLGAAAVAVGFGWWAWWARRGGRAREARR